MRVPARETDAEKLRIRDIGLKAGFDRGGRISPDVTPTPEGMATPLDGVIDISDKMSADGKVDWTAPEGRWVLMRFGYTPTDAINAPAPPEGVGLECDKLSREALDLHFTGMMAEVLKQAGPLAGKTLNNALIDSYERGCQNWTPAMRDEFRKRCGYDLVRYLPTLSGRVVGSIEQSGRFLWDFRRVISDLWCENYYGYFAELCRKRGLLSSAEVYGNGIFDNLQSGGAVDIPMGEFWVGGWTLETCKLAASSSHTYGRKLTGAESFTADDNHAKWAYDPYSIKALGDLAFTLGVNR